MALPARQATPCPTLLLPDPFPSSPSSAAATWLAAWSAGCSRPAPIRPRSASPTRARMHAPRWRRISGWPPSNRPPTRSTGPRRGGSLASRRLSVLSARSWPARCDWVEGGVFAVEPQVIRAVCTELAAVAQQARPLVVSIAAGIASAQLDRWLDGGLAVVRTMPNTPALPGAGVTGLYANPRVDAA